MLAADSLVLHSTVLTHVGQFPVALVIITIHTHHSIRVLPAVLFLLVVALVTAVVLVAAGRDHPVGHIREIVTLVWDLNLVRFGHSEYHQKLLVSI